MMDFYHCRVGMSTHCYMELNEVSSLSNIVKVKHVPSIRFTTVNKQQHEHAGST